MKELIFFKFQGIGNDFVVIDEIDKNYGLTSEEIKSICDRHFGIGADGLILAQASFGADFKMVFFNPDGTQAQMCGNGIRCLAKYLFDHGRTDNSRFVIETQAGFRMITLDLRDGKAVSAKVDMGRPNFMAKIIPAKVELEEFINIPIKVEGRELSATSLSLGNPHCVIFVDDLKNFPIADIGGKIENLPIFPERVNVEFAQVLSRNEIELKVWERGAGLTLACGTGACATVAAGVKNGLCERSVKINLPGGSLDVQWAESEKIYLAGSAKEVFSGKISL